MRFKSAANKVKIAKGVTKEIKKRVPPKPKTKARFRRTSCVGGDWYRAKVREEEASKMQEERQASAVIAFKRYLLKKGPMLVMAQWDDNNDGVITKLEFKKGLELYGLSVIMGAEVDTIFKTMDTNGDGIVEYSELEDFMKAEWSEVCDEEVHSVDIRRQYAENRAMMNVRQKRKDARKSRKKLAEAKAARERVIKDGNAIVSADAGAGSAVGTGGKGSRIAAEARVRHYLLNMRSKQDEKWRSARARGAIQIQSVTARHEIQIQSVRVRHEIQLQGTI
jgi:hypothetical protein